MAKRIKQLFISYSRDDKHWTYELAKAVREDLDLSVFVDYRSIHIGTDWWRTICDNIVSCDCVVYVMSPKSTESIYCKAEIDYAIALNKPILPIMLKATTFPTTLAEKRINYLTFQDSMQMPSLLLALQKGLGEVQYLLYDGEYKAPHESLYHPEEPRAKDTKSAEEVFELAIEAAEGGQLEQAATLLVEVVRVDTGRLGKRAQKRLNELDAYRQVARYASKTSTLRDARDLWQDYLQEFGKEFDPLNLATTLSTPPTDGKNAVPTTAPSPSVEATRRVAPPPTQPVSNPIAPPPTPSLSALDEAIARARTFNGKRNRDWIPFFAKLGEIDPSSPLPDLELCLVPVGSFMMGSDNGNSNEKPVHEQRITQPYWLGRYPITNRQWALGVQVGVVKEPQGDSSLEWYKDSAMVDCPVVGVDWVQSLAFAQWAKLSLPTEPLWEYGARGVENWVYPWGNEWEGGKRVVWKENSGGKPNPVTSKPEGASWVEALHLLGNVWEWQLSKVKPYKYETGDGREVIDQSGDVRGVRGGSWVNLTFNVRSALRSYFNPTFNFNEVGFRCSRFLGS